MIDPVTDKRWSTRFTDRDVGLLLILGLSIITLAVNLAITVWVAAKHGVKDNISDILGADTGYDCASVKNWNRWLHFGINVLPTLLLSASNYCAQLLVAPTRKKLDDAHQKQRWFDIGIQSFRNLRKAPLQHKLLWFSLMLSSGLLHLFWNSAVFSTTPFNTYSTGYVTADYLNDPQPWLFPENPDLDYIRQNALNLPKLNNKECIARYAGRLAGLSSLLLVSANVTMDHQLSYEQSNNRSSLLFNATTVSSAIFWRMNSDWMCNKWNVPNRVSCTQKTMRSPYEDTWTLVRFQFDANITHDPSDDIWTKVDHCLPRDELRNMDDKCTLRVSKVILSIVTFLNMIKCVIFKPKTLSAGDKSLYIVTLGDAIASFLQHGDNETKTCGLAGSRDFDRRWPSHVSGSQLPSIRWLHAASWKRWLLTICVITIGTVSFLLYMTIAAQQKQGVDTDIASLASYGLGIPQQFATALTGVTDALGPTKGFFFSVLFANMFQAIVSALYLLCNNLLTVMVVAAEWNAYSFRRKALRVSAPKGIQRSSFFLSLPYRYSVTLMVLSGLLHFFISQSVFVVQTVAYLPRYDPQRFIRAPVLDVSCIGFSSLGIILALTTGLVLVVYLAQGAAAELFRMPLVSTCSAAISANCHAHPADTDCSFLPVQWGYVTDGTDANGGRYTLTTDVSVRPFS
ncbi:hypothetical protein COCMIDRAFT_101097 [Bipolaris oryzae ATCC 44560]|uniref:DUF6536 domain-containing protein n=1 Tax=Bipolaris oryzae ATCC 44560 TaxID=930090 RepID=W6Z0X5_COCMI|nr:uncharacterized protein COCMIDRAFT_101097 [Bipolaris oryzae ATCC 44560]EUC43338.1 hypothetical protein COCMIDRAFT_101097 [Bipolaris oryzae ATCC 44560]